jgi:monoamine oxidase
MYNYYSKYLCPTIPPVNPTDNQRHFLLKVALATANRLEDYNNIIETLSPPAEITTILAPGSLKGMKIGIIGGGLAGLASAYELRKLGCDITVYDALKDRVGGRVYTYFFDKKRNLYGELGPMRIPVSHETTWHYINKFHLNTRPFVQVNENAFIYVRNIRVRNDSEGKNVKEKIYPQFNLTPWERNASWQELILYGLLTPLYMLSPMVRKEILQILPRYSKSLLYWTGLNIRQVMEVMGLSQEAINLISSIAPLAGSFYYNSYIEILQEEYPVSFSSPYEIVNGTFNLPLGFYQSLMSIDPKDYDNIPKEALGKVEWKSGTWINSINYSLDRDKVTLQYSDRYCNHNGFEEFDYVVCAIPYSTLRNVNVNPLFSTMKMQAIKEATYSNAQKALFLCKNRFWEKQGIVGGGSYTDLPISSIWYPSDHAMAICNSNNTKPYCCESPIDNWGLIPGASPNEPGVLLASYNFTQDAIRLGNINNTRRFREIKDQVSAVHGLNSKYIDSIVDDFKSIEWYKEEAFKGAFCYFSPEQRKLFAYVMSLPEYNGKLVFAGEHISPSHGWMQGALNTGMKAANQIAIDFIKNPNGNKSNPAK